MRCIMDDIFVVVYLTGDSSSHLSLDPNGLLKYNVSLIANNQLPPWII